VSPDELRDALIALYAARDEEMRARFGRSLPLDEAVFDRWQRAKQLGFGEGTSIYHSACVFGDVKVGEHCWIGPNTLLDGSGGGIKIGSYCSISAGVHIYTHDTMRWALSGGRLPYRQRPVSIGSCVYVGAQCVIASGVTIGERCVIAANSLVIDDVPDGTIAGGTPARTLGEVIGSGESVRLEWHRSGWPR